MIRPSSMTQRSQNSAFYSLPIQVMCSRARLTRKWGQIKLTDNFLSSGQYSSHHPHHQAASLFPGIGFTQIKNHGSSQHQTLAGGDCFIPNPREILLWKLCRRDMKLIMLNSDKIDLFFLSTINKKEITSRSFSAHILLTCLLWPMARISPSSCASTKRGRVCAFRLH